MIALKNRPETTSDSPLECLCQDIPLNVLLGQEETSSKLPAGWELSKGIVHKKGMDCYVFSVRSRGLIPGKYHEYCELGKFAEVKSGNQKLRVFLPECLAVLKF